MITPHVQCCCPDCVAIRRAFVVRTHPLLRARAEEPGPSLIPVPQAIAMEMETIEDLTARLAIANHNLKALRDEA